MLAPQTPCRPPPLCLGESASAEKSRVCSEDPPSFITEVVAVESEGSGSFCSLMTVTRTGVRWGLEQVHAGIWPPGGSRKRSFKMTRLCCSDLNEEFLEFFQCAHLAGAALVIGQFERQEF